MTGVPKRAMTIVLTLMLFQLGGVSAHAAPPPWAKGPSEKACQGPDVEVQHQGLSCRVAGGLWKVKLRNGHSILTHGPDTLLSSTASLPATAARQPVCASANPHGNYSQVAIIAWPSDVTPTETDATFRSQIQNLNGRFYSDAIDSGSPSGADYVYACDAVGQIRVDRVALPTASTADSFSSIVSDLQAKGYRNANEKYVIWYDAAMPYCGAGTFAGDERHSVDNYSNIGPDYGIAYKCDSLQHENGHNLGAVQYNAPYSTGSGGHCWQEYDIMCYADGGDRYPGSLTYTCTDANHFDCQHNDYFDAQIGAGQGGATGSYLDTRWNIGECDNRWIVNYACPGTIPPGPGSPPRSRSVSTGPGSGSDPLVKSFDQAGTAQGSFLAYAQGFQGGVRVAAGDVNGDGVTDTITAAGPGGGPHVRVFNGVDGSPISGFFAYPAGFTGGVYVAAADLNADGKAEVITGPGSGSDPLVKVFDGRSGALQSSFLAYAQGFQGGVRVAVGDVTGDATPEIITGADQGGGPHVRIFSAGGTAISGFFPYPASFTGGVFVAAGDLNGDGKAEIVTGPGSGSDPLVKSFDWAGNPKGSFLAYGQGFQGGVRVAAGDLNADGKAEIVTGAGPGGGPHVRVFNGVDNSPISGFFAYPTTFTGGVFVAAG